MDHAVRVHDRLRLHAFFIKRVVEPLEVRPFEIRDTGSPEILKHILFVHVFVVVEGVWLQSAFDTLPEFIELIECQIIPVGREKAVLQLNIRFLSPQLIQISGLYGPSFSEAVGPAVFVSVIIA